MAHRYWVALGACLLMMLAPRAAIAGEPSNQLDPPSPPRVETRIVLRKINVRDSMLNHGGANWHEELAVYLAFTMGYRRDRFTLSTPVLAKFTDDGNTDDLNRTFRLDDPRAEVARWIECTPVRPLPLIGATAYNLNAPKRDDMPEGAVSATDTIPGLGGTVDDAVSKGALIGSAQADHAHYRTRDGLTEIEFYRLQFFDKGGRIMGTLDFQVESTPLAENPEQCRKFSFGALPSGNREFTQGEVLRGRNRDLYIKSGLVIPYREGDSDRRSPNRVRIFTCQSARYVFVDLRGVRQRSGNFPSLDVDLPAIDGISAKTAYDKRRYGIRLELDKTGRFVWHESMLNGLFGSGLVIKVTVVDCSRNRIYEDGAVRPIEEAESPRPFRGRGRDRNEPSTEPEQTAPSDPTSGGTSSTGR